jgi:hypothetical protein
MQPESHIRKLVDDFVSVRIDHERFQREFASAWSAVSESADGQEKYLAYKVQSCLADFVEDLVSEQEKYLAYKVQSCLADFVEDLVSEQELMGKLASIALPTQQVHVALQIQVIPYEEERIAPWADQGSSNISGEVKETLGTSNETMIHNTS